MVHLKLYNGDILINAVFFLKLQSTGAVVTESQTYKKRADFLSNDDYAVYVRENIQVSSAETRY